MNQRALERVLRQMPALYNHLGISEKLADSARVIALYGTKPEIMVNVHSEQFNTEFVFDSTGVLQAVNQEFRANFAGNDEKGLLMNRGRGVNAFRRSFDKDYVPVEIEEVDPADLEEPESGFSWYDGCR